MTHTQTHTDTHTHTCQEEGGRGGHNRDEPRLASSPLPLVMTVGFERQGYVQGGKDC